MTLARRVASATGLPQPSDDALAHSARLVAHIGEAIAAAGGWLPFARYMELALYAPGLGYYSAGARKLGADGDFITAPELTPLFGHVLAQQVAELFRAAPRRLLEVGPGSGALAASVLEMLEELAALPAQYLILELSADLRERSRATLAARVPHLAGRVAWLDRLPAAFSGVVLGNEVLDAMPAEVFRVAAHGIEQAGVTLRTDGTPGFAWAYRPAPAELAAAVARLAPSGLAPGYTSELSLAARGFARSIAGMLAAGAAIFIDYGFPRREYYHPQRSEGTLMCHYRHRAHADPFFLPGLQDITAHVDFSAMADAAVSGGLQVLGYATQAQFLINCGITDLLSQRMQAGGDAETGGGASWFAASNAAQHLLSPAEMGELFKVIAFGRGVAPALSGFLRGDKTATL
ncbi:MAG: class I SAM-dependent methyltransferase [Betaproteobacteria bacterium]|nr:class I SAM-dependent methyltransferase [Betaproteobacteria bacterium]